MSRREHALPLRSRLYILRRFVRYKSMATVLTELLSSEFKSIPSTLLFYKTNYILFYKPVNELK